MPKQAEINCIVPDSSDADRRIDTIGGYAGGGWSLFLDDAIRLIEEGTWSFFVRQGSNTVHVVVAHRNGRKYLKTVADGVEPNNLLSLPTCP